MPRGNNNDDELDDDDEDGSKAEEGDYEDVKPFEEDKDLGPAMKGHKSSPNKPSPNSSAATRKPRQQTTTAATTVTVPAANADGLDSAQALNNVGRIVSIPWAAAAGKRPPRDMKRLDQAEWYVVCKVMKWGDTPALFVRANTRAESDFGFYKPPAQFYTYNFQIGDRLQLSQIGYSSSRNKIATSIRVKPTHMFPVPDSKFNWVAPPITDGGVGMASSSEPKAKSAKKDKIPSVADNSMWVPTMSTNNNERHSMTDMMSSSSSTTKRNKKLRLEHGGAGNNSSVGVNSISMHAAPLRAHDRGPHIQTFSPMGMGGPQHVKKEQQPRGPYNLFNGGPGPQNFTGGGLGQTGPGGMSASNFFGFQPGTPDINRAGSFSNFHLSMSDLFGGASSANLLPPSSPHLLGSNSPLMGGGGAGQPTMHRIASTGGFGSFSSISSPSTNCPPFSTSFGFPSTSNMMNFSSAGDHTTGS